MGLPYILPSFRSFSYSSVTGFFSFLVSGRDAHHNNLIVVIRLRDDQPLRVTRRVRHLFRDTRGSLSGSFILIFFFYPDRNKKNSKFLNWFGCILFDHVLFFFCFFGMSVTGYRLPFQEKCDVMLWEKGQVWKCLVCLRFLEWLYNTVFFFFSFLYNIYLKQTKKTPLS